LHSAGRFIKNLIIKFLSDRMPPRQAPPNLPAAPGRVVLVHRSLIHLSRRLHQLVQARTHEALAPEGVTAVDYGALKTIENDPGIDQRRLAAALAVDRTHAGLIAEGLEARGLITRRPDPADRRVRRLELSMAGAALKARAQPGIQALQEALLAALAPEERQAFLHMVQRIVASGGTVRPGSTRRPRRKRIDHNTDDQ
jgi:DNA-binding MarR family transcriptional regulator